MKNMKKILASTALVLSLLLPQNISAAVTPINPTTITSIIDTSSVPASSSYTIPTGEYANVVSFSITQPSYVYVSAYSTVKSTYLNGGNIDIFAVYSDEGCTRPVAGDSSSKVDANKRTDKYLCLEAGTYYIKFGKNPGALLNDKSSGTFTLSVGAQPLDVTVSKNASLDTAQKIATDKLQTSLLSNGTRSLWVTFEVPSKTTANIQTSLANPLSSDKMPCVESAVTLYDANYKVIKDWNIPNRYYETSNSGSLSLASGTYYLKVSGAEHYLINKYGDVLRENTEANFGIVNMKITTLKKTSISKLTNVKGKKAKVSYKKVANAKGYEVQYSTSKKFSQNVKTKNAGAKTSITLSKLTQKKTYYVRVRAYTIDGNGQKELISAWSATKKVTIKK